MDGSPRRLTITHPQLEGAVHFWFWVSNVHRRWESAPLALEKVEFVKGQDSRKHSPRSELDAVILYEKLSSIERVRALKEHN